MWPFPTLAISVAHLRDVPLQIFITACWAFQPAEELFELDGNFGDNTSVYNGASERSIGSLPEHSRVRLRRDFPEDGVRTGEDGTIVHVYRDGGYEVEMISDRSKPAAVTVETTTLRQPQRHERASAMRITHR